MAQVAGRAGGQQFSTGRTSVAHDDKRPLLGDRYVSHMGSPPLSPRNNVKSVAGPSVTILAGSRADMTETTRLG